MVIKAIKSTLTLWRNDSLSRLNAAKRKAKYKYVVSNTYYNLQKYTIDTSKHLNTKTLPIKNWFKFTYFSVRTNNVKRLAETTSSGNAFQILNTRTAKKCFL